jgi:integrase/recombinase XerD
MASLKYFKSIKRWRVFWHITLLDGTVEKGSRSFKSKTQAKLFKSQIEQKSIKLKSSLSKPNYTLKDTLEDWLVCCKKHTASTQYLYQMVIRDFVNILPKKVIYITDLAPIHIQSYMNKILGRGSKNRTCNAGLTAIKSYCRYLSENYGIPNPASTVKMLKEDPPVVNFITKEQYLKVLACCDEYMSKVIKFLANTGLRSSEFRKLTWDCYDAKTKSITIVGKGRKKRTVPLNKTCIDILNELKEQRSVSAKDLIFVSKTGKPFLKRWLHQNVSRVFKKGGFRGSPHSLRHFFATQLLLNGVSMIKTSLLLGHYSVVITQSHYSHIMDEDLVSVTEVLDQ